MISKQSFHCFKAQQVVLELVPELQNDPALLSPIFDKSVWPREFHAQMNPVVTKMLKASNAYVVYLNHIFVI